MSDEELKINLEELDSGTLESAEPVVESEYSPAEEKAMSSGWRPEEEWTGDPDDWVDARTFNRNGEFMSRIQNQTKQLNANAEEVAQLKAGIKELGEHNKKIAEQEYKNAMDALKKEKILALAEEDHVAAEEIRDKIAELKETKREEDKTVEHNSEENNAGNIPNPVFMEWADTNKWYKSDVLLRGAADAIGMEYADTNPGAPIEEVLQYVTKTMKQEFPDRFGNTRRNNPGSVTEPSGEARRPTKKAKYTPKDLSDEQRQFAKMFVATGAFESEQEYVDSLVKTGDL